MPILSGGSELDFLNKTNSRHGALLQRIITGVNTLAKNVNSSAVGQIQAPQPPTGVNVSTGSDHVHFSIEHPGFIRRGIHYLSEIATDPQFTQIVAIGDHGASRTPHPVALPAKSSVGVSHVYYLRVAAQHISSEPSLWHTYGGTNSPTGITLTGTSQLDFVQSTGSGTSSNSGTQTGQGLGRFSTRRL